MKYTLGYERKSYRRWLVIAALAAVFALTILFVLWLVLVRVPAEA